MWIIILDVDSHYLDYHFMYLPFNQQNWIYLCYVKKVHSIWWNTVTHYSFCKCFFFNILFMGVDYKGGEDKGQGNNCDWRVLCETKKELIKIKNRKETLLIFLWSPRPLCIPQFFPQCFHKTPRASPKLSPSVSIDSLKEPLSEDSYARHL